MEVFAFWFAFIGLSSALIVGIERLFPEEVDAIAEMLGFGDQPQWRE